MKPLIINRKSIGLPDDRRKALAERADAEEAEYMAVRKVACRIITTPSGETRGRPPTPRVPGQATQKVESLPRVRYAYELLDPDTGRWHHFDGVVDAADWVRQQTGYLTDVAHIATAARQQSKCRGFEVRRRQRMADSSRKKQERMTV